MSKLQMFCFAYAGGNASFFDLIEKDLQGFDLVKIEYAGHGTRHKESCYQNFNELADDIYPLLKKQYSGNSYALFGYSMGTITLVEMIKRIVDDPEMREPSHVFLAAHEPHSKSELAEFTDDKLDEWIKNRTIMFGAVPDKLINNKSFWRMYLPLYRADYSIIRTYKFEALNLKVNIPATIFYSETDTPRTEMELWRNYFIGDCKYYEFPGNHFFIQEYYQEMARIMNSRIWRQGEHYDF